MLHYFWDLIRGSFSGHGFVHVQFPICQSCNFFTPFTLLIFHLPWIESLNISCGNLFEITNLLLNDPASMDVSDQPLHKYMAMCFLIQECCCVIRLVGITQIPSFLRIMSDYTLMRGGYFSR